MPSRRPPRPGRALRLALGLGLLLVPAAGAELIERVLAVVDDVPVLLSEVLAAERLRGVDRGAALQAVIDETLMLREASRLPESAVSPEEEQRGLESLEAKLDDQARRAIGEGELRHIARRQTAILKYVELRFRPQVRVDDEAVFRAYEQEYAGRMSPPVFEAVAPEIQKRLAARALDERIEAWVAELRAAARIRLNP